MGRTGEGAALNLAESRLPNAPPMAGDLVEKGFGVWSKFKSDKAQHAHRRRQKKFQADHNIIQDHRRHRQENADFNRFVVSAISDNLVIGQRIRHQRRLNAARREETNDYHSIRSMLPANFPDKDDVIGAIFEVMLTGSLKRENVKARVQAYIAAHNRMFPTKFAKFGDLPAALWMRSCSTAGPRPGEIRSAAASATRRVEAPRKGMDFKSDWRIDFACHRRCAAGTVIGQVREHSGAGHLGLSERLKGRAADLYGAPALIDRTPGCDEAGTSMEAGTTAALEADHERKAVAARVPYLQIFNGIDDATELHDASDVRPTLLEGGSTSLSRKMQRC